MREVTPPSANFPYAVVGFVPDLGQMLDQCDQEMGRFFGRTGAAFLAETGRVRDFAIDVQLKLLVRRVADSHRRARLVTRKPWELDFGKPALAAEPVHDL